MVHRTVNENIGTITEMTAMIDRIAEGIIEIALGMTVMTEAGTGLEKGNFPEIMATMLEIEVQATVHPGQDQEQVQIGIEFNVINVGNMVIFQGTVPLSREEREIEQLLQMLSLGDKQTSITSSNMQDNFSRTNSEENIIVGPLNF